MLTMQSTESGRASERLSGGPSALDRLGFSVGGAISSRTAMLSELQMLLTVVPVYAPFEAYRHAVEVENVLHKASSSNRAKTWKFLSNLYGLDPRLPILRQFRKMYAIADADRSLLTALLAMAREPILRASLGMVLDCPVGRWLGREDFEAWIRKFAPGRYSESMYLSFSHNLYASFFQFGYLGKSALKVRLRTRPQNGMAAVAFAAFLDWLCGRNGIALITSEYSRALDLPREDHLAFLSAAGRQGLMRVAYSGGVLDLDFGDWLLPHERRLIV